VVLTRLVITRLRVSERGKYRRCLGELMIVVALIGGKPRIIPRHAGDRRTVVWGVKTRVGKIGCKARGMRGLGLGRRTLTPLRIRSIQTGLLHGAAPRELLRATGGEDPGRASPSGPRQAGRTATAAAYAAAPTYGNLSVHPCAPLPSSGRIIRPRIPTERDAHVTKPLRFCDGSLETDRQSKPRAGPGTTSNPARRRRPARAGTARGRGS